MPTFSSPRSVFFALSALVFGLGCSGAPDESQSASFARTPPEEEPTPREPPPPPPPTVDPGGDPTPGAKGMVGRIDATFDVDPTGAARYTIPIKVPPGTLGVQPKISLSYNSHGENDVAGVGMSIGGLSRIERCPQTMAQDGRVGAVMFDGEDRFCLDGLRLMAVDGEYGTPGTVYHTESQTWSKVVGGESCKDDVFLPSIEDPVRLSGPCSFDVTLRNGSRVTYGGAGAQCAFLGQETNVRLFWPMTRVEDLNGNTIEVEWQNGGTNTCVPKRILYTGNTNTGQTPLREVSFSYDNNRADAVRTFTGGVPFRLGVLLRTIETFIKDPANPSQKTLVKKYGLQYGGPSGIAYSADSNRALLTAIEECDGNGNCLPPTQLSWTHGDWMANAFVKPTNGVSQIPPIHPTSPLLTGDFDGDGNQDYLKLPTEQYTAGAQYLQKDPAGNNFDALPWITYDPGTTAFRRWFVGDVNGDGFTDVVWTGNQSFGNFTGWRLYLGTAQGLGTTPDTSGSAPSLDDEVHLGDFTGDGRTDLLALVDKNNLCANGTTQFAGWEIHPSTGTGFGPPTTGDFDQGPFPVLWHACDGFTFWPAFYLADFNGDGRVDFLTTKRLEDADNPNQNSINQKYYTGWRLYLSDGSTFVESANGVWPYDKEELTLTTGDFNGDGMTDVVITGKGVVGQPGHVLLRSTGRTLEPVLKSTSTFTIDLLGGTGPYTMTWGYTSLSFDACDRLEVGNFNDDGLDDLLATSALCYGQEYDGALLWISKGDGFDHVATVSKPQDDHHLLGRFQPHGRTGILMRGAPNEAFYQVYQTPDPDLLTHIIDGVSAEIGIGYAHHVGELSHDYGVVPAYPKRRFVGPFDMAATVEKDNGNGEKHRFQYYYSGPMTDLTGRGFLGFQEITQISKQPYRRLDTEYHTDFPKAGLVKRQRNRGFYPNDFDHFITDFTYVNKPHPSYPGIYNLVLTNERTEEYTWNGQYAHTSGKDYQHDDFGFVTQVNDRADISDSTYDLKTSTKYHHDTVKWRIGFPKEVRTYSTSWNDPHSLRRMVPDASMNIEKEERWDSLHQQWLTTVHEYDAVGQRFKTTDWLGSSTVYEFDDYGFLEKETNALGQVVETEHDPRFGNEIRRVDQNGNTVETKTNGFGFVTEIWAPDPNTQNLTLVRKVEVTTPGYGWITQSFVRRDWNSTAEWDWMEEHRDGWGRVYRNRRRGVGNTAIVTDKEYSGFDTVERTSRPYFEGSTPEWTEYFYDAKKRIVKVVAPGNVVIENRYDDLTRSVVKVDPNLEETRLYLTPRHKLGRLVDPNGAQTFMDYDPMGRLVATTDPAGFSSTTYDSLGRKLMIVDVDTGTTTFHYDVKGQLVSETDAKGQVVWRVYDALGRTVQKSFIAPGEQSSSRVVTFEYDDPSLTNAIGQLAHATTYVQGTQQSRYSFAYDPAGHQAQARLDYAGRSFTWKERFDPAGNVHERVYPDGSILKVDFSSAGFVDTLALNEPTDPAGYFKTYADYDLHDPEARPGLVTYGNDVATCYRYDADSKLLKRTATSHFSQGVYDVCSERLVEYPGEKRYLDLAYDWTKSNLIEKITDNLDPSRTQGFMYSSAGELTQASGPYGTRIFTYHAGGALHLKDGVFYTYQGHRPVSGSDGSTFVYDANGNLTSKTRGMSSWTLDWNLEDRLASVTKDGAVTSFTYDFAGQRLEKRDPNGTTTLYIGSSYEITTAPDGTEQHTKYIDGPSGRVVQITRTGVSLVSLMPVEYYAGLAEMFAWTDAGGALQKVRYLSLSVLKDPDVQRGLLWALLVLVGLAWLLATGWIFVRLRSRREPHRFGRRTFALTTPAVLLAFFATYGTGLAEASMNAGSNGAGVPEVGVYYLHQDHLGSTLVVTDDTGSEVSRVQYEPYGEIYQAGSSGTDHFRPKFTGKELDEGIGLYYFGARYYDPSTGRFISADRSVGADVPSGLAFNRYAYAKNNPITYTDPSGHFVAFFVAMIVGFVVGALIAGTQGKIFTDPSHAFDRWSWSRALFGGWIGMITAGITFGLGTIGTSSVTAGASFLGVPVGELAAKTFMGGVVSVAMEYAAGERDTGRLVAYFGLGLLFSFVSGSNVLGMAKEGLGKIAGEAFTSYAYSALKSTVNSDKPYQMTIWYFKLTFDKHGFKDMEVNEFFFLTQVAESFVNAWGFDDEAAERVKEGWSFEKMAVDIVDAEKRLGWVSQLTGILPNSYGAPGPPSMMGTLTTMLKNLFHAATGPCKGNGCGFYDDVVKKGIDAGIGAIGGGYGALQNWSKEEFEEAYE